MLDIALWQFQLLRVIPLIVLFAYAGYKDFKTGEVSNKVWLYAPIGLVLTILEMVFFTPSLAVFTFTVMIVMALFCFGLFFFSHGLIGGADSKALVTLCLCMPLSPSLCVYVGVYPLIAFALAAFVLVFKKIFINKEFNLWQIKSRFLPYLFLGMLIALI